MNNIILLFFAGIKTINGEITYGRFVAFNQYTSQTLGYINSLTSVYDTFNRIFLDWQRFFEIYEYEPKIKSGQGKRIELKGEIELDNICFNYPSSRLLKYYLI